MERIHIILFNAVVVRPRVKRAGHQASFSSRNVINVFTRKKVNDLFMFTTDF